jgi:hypothetical protein
MIFTMNLLLSMRLAESGFPVIGNYLVPKSPQKGLTRVSLIRYVPF